MLLSSSVGASIRFSRGRSPTMEEMARREQELEHAASRYLFDAPSKSSPLARNGRSMPELQRAATDVALPSTTTPCGQLTPKSPKATAADRCCPTDLCDAVRRLLGRPALSDKDVPEGLAFDSPENAVIIFDWDDTLFPTTFLVHHVLPNLAEPKAQQDPRDVLAASPHYESLQQHAHIVEFVLRAARKFARVAIVTLSVSPWVEASALRYLPGLDMVSLLRELDIDVYYSRQHVKANSKAFEVTLDRRKAPKNQVGVDVDLCDDGRLLVRHVAENGAAAMWNVNNPDKAMESNDLIVAVNDMRENLVNLCRTEQLLRLGVVRQYHMDKHVFVDAKAKDMTACLEKLYPTATTCRRNVISIGDSTTEQDALHELLLPKGDRKALCKTVNMLNVPSLKQLSNELRLIMVWLPAVVSYNKNFDLSMDALGSLERELFS
eukprot:TRINITY_DN9418_c0_g1_i1.p1 TRINITY_DN9418_c0_g1~~TRINITY_DN9418_c0_g1_i1.p1  ORF type:complete len:436 (-),score=90.03 TRINITY_DN9418_c0_g1_i1:258-1565(-)